MKIELDIPAWAEERNIYVMAGVEMVAYRLAHEGEFKVKSVRCSGCGKCCMDLPEGHIQRNDSGNCIHLVPDGEKWVCDLGVHRPFSCGTGFQQKGFTEGCSVEYS